MSDTKFTPGPWSVHGRRDAEIVSAGENTIAKCFGSYSHGTVGQIDANSALIAAAPDLFEALEAAMPFLASQPTDSVIDVLKAANSALKKARGET